MLRFEVRGKKMQTKHAKCVTLREGSILAEAGQCHPPDPIHKGRDW